MEYALVTGATGVLGGAFCRALAAQGRNLFLTGRSEEKLGALKAQLTAEYASANIIYCPCDLSSDAEREKLFSAAENLKFNALYNIAGADIQQAFEKYSERQIIFQIRSTFEGAVSLLRFALAHRGASLKVLNISSVSGMLPMPYFSVYSASKAALTSFSVAVNREYKNLGVKIQVALPGAIYTRPDVREYIKHQGAWGRLAAKSPEWVVKKCLKFQKKKKAKTVLGFCNKITAFFNSLLPLSLRLKFVERRWRKTSKNAFFKGEENEQS